MRCGVIVCFLVACLLINSFGIDFKRTEENNFVLTSIFVLFSSLHISWDFIILSNHRSVVLEDGKLIFHGNGDDLSSVALENIDRAEKFPTPEDIYDYDYVANMMSSGLRLIDKEGKKYLIFSKIKDFKQIEQKLYRS